MNYRYSLGWKRPRPLYVPELCVLVALLLLTGFAN